MPRKKFEINATQEQLNQLYDSLQIGAPIKVALFYAGISSATYYWWVEIASNVRYLKEKAELEKQEGYIKSGLDVHSISKEALTENTMGKSRFLEAVEPSGDMLLRYKNVVSFRKFADDVYTIICECEKRRSISVLEHLQTIRKASKDRRINPNPSQWFLERTLPDSFGRQVLEPENTPTVETKPIKVEFIEPNKKDAQERLKAMEDSVLNQQESKDA